MDVICLVVDFPYVKVSLTRVFSTRVSIADGKDDLAKHLTRARLATSEHNLVST